MVLLFITSLLLAAPLPTLTGTTTLSLTPVLMVLEFRTTSTLFVQLTSLPVETNTVSTLLVTSSLVTAIILTLFMTHII